MIICLHIYTDSKLNVFGLRQALVKATMLSLEFNYDMELKLQIINIGLNLTLPKQVRI